MTDYFLVSRYGVLWYLFLHKKGTLGRDTPYFVCVIYINESFRRQSDTKVSTGILQKDKTK